MRWVKSDSCQFGPYRKKIKKRSKKMTKFKVMQEYRTVNGLEAVVVESYKGELAGIIEYKHYKYPVRWSSQGICTFAHEHLVASEQGDLDAFDLVEDPDLPGCLVTEYGLFNAVCM